jgi:hypothetical protein
MNNLDWYEVTEGPSLLQGDVLGNCPVFAVSDSLSWPLWATADIKVEAKVFDLVVMTQSCDLENEKVQDVLLAQLVAWNDAVRAEVERGNGLRSPYREHLAQAFARYFMRVGLPHDARAFEQESGVT